MKNFSSHTAIIGAGAMGSAIGKGLINSKLKKPNEIVFLDLDHDKLKALKEEYDFSTVYSLEDLIKNFSLAELIIAVKPKDINSLLEAIKSAHLSSATRIISIAAAIKISVFEKYFPENPVLRVMPNTPCQISKGISVISANEKVSSKDLDEVKNFFKSLGLVLIMDESKLDIVTAISGSGPAYFFLMIEALRDAGKLLGLDELEARLLAEHTAFGACNLILEAGEDASILRERVTSPNGTTASALALLQKENFSKIIYKAIEAAKERSIEMSL